MKKVAISLTAISLMATFLPFIQSPYWWIRIFDFPRVQIAVLCLLSVVLVGRYVGHPRALRVLSLLALTAAMGYHTSLIVIYTPLHPTEAKASNRAWRGNTLSLIVSNVRMKNRLAHDFLQIVHQQNPDLLLVNEPDAWWAKQLAELDLVYPYSLKHPLGNTYGMMLYSKLPLANRRVNFLVKPDIPSFFANVILPTGDTLDLHCLHPMPPKPGTESYERDAEILQIGQMVRQRRRPAMVAGDMNDVAWSRTSRLFQRYSGMVDPRVGRGFFNTYSVFVPLFRYPLDHVFYTHEFGLIGMEKLDSFGSDHFPLRVDLSYEPRTDNTYRPADPRSGDRRRVRQRIREGT